MSTGEEVPCVELRGQRVVEPTSGARALARWLILLAGIGAGAAVWLGTDEDGLRWAGLGVMILFALLLVGRIIVGLRPGGRERMAGRAEALEDPASGAPSGRVALARAGVKRGRKLRGGTPATARILAVQDLHRSGTAGTLTYLELEIHYDGGCALVATGALVRPIQVAALTPGGELVVEIDPADPTTVAIDWTETLRVPEGR